VADDRVIVCGKIEVEDDEGVEAARGGDGVGDGAVSTVYARI
jgi:hypothetical protein